MAITWIEEPVTRPTLRLVEGPAVTPTPGARKVRPRRLRARFLVGAVAVAAIVGLAVPLSVLGGHPAPGAFETSQATGGSIDAATAVYVVHPGDTLSSIAARFDASDPHRLMRLLERETASTSVVPGERLVVP